MWSWKEGLSRGYASVGMHFDFGASAGLDGYENIIDGLLLAVVVLVKLWYAFLYLYY